MPAYSFQPEFLYPLLMSTKDQTTRPFTNKAHVGDIGYIYIQQRMQIATKPLLRLTQAGIDMVRRRCYPIIPEFYQGIYHAHFLGTVQIAQVIDIHPCGMDDKYLLGWAVDDGFANFEAADEWFSGQYDENWMDDWWTVVLWEGWLERYFEAGEGCVI
jgi:hypothetical protein